MKTQTPAPEKYEEGGLFCQSCGMPIDEKELRGAEKDGSPSEEYCIYCYRDGNFTQDVTMEQMIQHCADLVDEFNRGAGTNYTREQSVRQMRLFFPHLKRWKKQ